MKNLLTIAALDIKESFRSRWFLLYLLIFSGLVAAFFITGVTDSRVLGFSGLSRLLLLFIQICIIILPIFVLVTTSKAILADRDLNILEYQLPDLAGAVLLRKGAGKAIWSLRADIFIAAACDRLGCDQRHGHSVGDLPALYGAAF